MSDLTPEQTEQVLNDLARMWGKSRAWLINYYGIKETT